MYLKEVLINGFKSFADKTEIALRPGITAIIGPNGCGKSNIVDAIRWVLGEQSAKALRGGAMHDVIFSGTDKRKQLPLCEVQLVFSDCEKDLGTAFNEIAILRRVSRDGASDYYLNGKACRLKDIQRLFMDTGVGRVSYSFMVQGQIDQILSANPAERRTLFEEAAGITRYKTQRRDALNKLSSTDQNLARVSDVIDELTRQINSLKRQAAKALRFKRIKHRLTHLDLAYLGNQWHIHNNTIQTVEAQANEYRASKESQEETLRSQESILTEIKQKRAEIYGQIQSSQEIIFGLHSEKESAESQLQIASSRQKDLSERIISINSEIESFNQRRSELEIQIQVEKDTKSQQATDVAGIDEHFQVRQNELNEILNQKTKYERQIIQEKQDLLMKEGEMTRFRSTLTNTEVDLKTSEIRHTEIENALAGFKEQGFVYESRLGEINIVLEGRRAEESAIRQKISETETQNKSLANQFKEQQQLLSTLDRQVARLSSQINFLNQLQKNYEGYSKGAKAILTGDFSNIISSENISAISSLITITEPVFAPAIELILGRATEAICINNSEKLPALLNELASKELSKTILKIGTNNFSEKENIQLPSSIRPANSILSIKDEKYAAALNELFNDSYICDDILEFIQFCKENPQFKFLMVASLNGESFDCRGILQTASTEKENVGIFQRENEIQKLNKSLTEENERLTDETQHSINIQAEIEENERRIEEFKQEAAVITQEINQITIDERTTLKAIEQNQEQIQRNEQNLNQLEEEKVAALSRMENAKKALEEKERIIAEIKSNIAEKENIIADLQIKSDEYRETVNEVKFKLAQKRQELDLIEKTTANINSQIEELNIRLESRTQEKERCEIEIITLKKDAETYREKGVSIVATLNVATENLESLRNQYTASEKEIESMDAGLNEKRNNLRDIESKLSTIEIKLTEESSQRAFINEKTQAEYQLDISTIDWKEQLWLADETFESKIKFDELDDPNEESEKEDSQPRQTHSQNTPTEEELQAMDNTDWPPIQREIIDLRNKLSYMGAVNHTAIEEYIELRDRYVFLKTQADDLWKAKNELIKAIDEINATSQKLFTDTFTQIQKNFKFTFERLFNGGESDLQLVQSEDVLESGIEIIARPPGTKLKSISLLSGGQRTMTAVALLFAIYMVKPSPFCVLDELDAPLDDANVGRFTDIIKEFTKYSQFLVVTHNKRTVSAADTIYGVTMQERGVTQLVSMRYNSENNETESNNENDKKGFHMAR